MPNDYPIEECARVALEIVQRGADIHQKWTCGHCGSRQTMSQPNVFYRAGKCEECGGVTAITHCNYLMIASILLGGER